VGYVAHMEDVDVYKISVGRPERKRPLGGPEHGWEYYIIMDLKGIWWEDVNWIHVAQDMDQWQVIVYTAINFKFP